MLTVCEWPVHGLVEHGPVPAAGWPRPQPERLEPALERGPERPVPARARLEPVSGATCASLLRSVWRPLPSCSQQRWNGGSEARR